jgi:hypothetical protein
MPSSNPVATEIVHDAVRKWRDLPSRTLARKILADNPGVFRSVDTVRNSVLYWRGRRMKKPSTAVESATPSLPWRPDLALPPTDAKDFLPFTIDVRQQIHLLVLADLHIPYHAPQAIAAAIKGGRAHDANMLIIDGDLLDFHRISRFLKDPRARSVKDEIEMAKQFLDALDEWFPKARRIFKFGNHDERLDKYLRAFAPEIYNIASDKMSLEVLLELADRGWEAVSDQRPIQIGSLTILHGHEFPTPVIGPVNAARGLFLRTKANALEAHLHQTSEHTEATVRGKLISTWSIGCLCDLHPAYARFNRWNWGYAGIEVATDGDFQVHNRKIIDGVVY